MSLTKCVTRSWVYFAELLGNFYTFYIVITGTILCIVTGISTSWPSPVLFHLNQTNIDNPLGRQITDNEYDLIGSVFSIGGAIGPLLLVYSVGFLGRKYTMILIAMISSICYTVLTFSGNITWYYISRIALGIAFGGSSGLVAVYVSEISSPAMRGTYLSLGTSYFLIGCFLSNTLGSLVSFFNFNLFIALLSFLYIPIFLLSCPESLYDNLQKFGPDNTLLLLKKLRRNDMEHEELEEIKICFQKEEQGSFLDVFKSSASCKAFFVCTILLALQQMCGINAIITYSQKFFEDSKSSIDPKLCSIIVSVVQTSTSFITPLSAKYVDRKILLTISFAGVSTSTLFLGLYFIIEFLQCYRWLPLSLIILFVIFYNCGLGALPWAALGELYPSNVKSAGSAMSVSIYWILQFVVTFFYNKVDSAVCFFIFSLICLFAIAFVQFFLVETRGKSLHEIQKSMK